MFNLLLPNVMDLPILDVFESKVQIPIVKEVQPESKTTKKIHTVRKNDNLSKIAKKYNTTWQRIFYKNKQLKDPNKLVVGQVLQIPKKYERLKKRSYYIPIIRSAPRINDNIVQSYVQENPIGDVSGNTYSYGYCTWYVKNLRPDLPNNLGNADTWFVMAQSQGMSVGYEPRAGAVGEALTGTMHVVYVKEVRGGQVLVSEMNYRGWNVASERWASSSEFRYIY